MIITHFQLKQIINEEVSRVLHAHQLINKVNIMAYNSYGIQLSECLTLREQMYVVQELRCGTANEEFMNAMTLCGLIKKGAAKRGALNENIGTIIAALRGGYQIVRQLKFWNFLVGHISKRIALKKYTKALKELQEMAAAKCTEILPPESPELEKCAAGMVDIEQLAPLKENIGTKVAKLVKSIFTTINEKFTKLLVYIGAVIKFKTLKPSEEQKNAAAPIVKKIMIVVNLGITLYLVAGMIMSGAWIMGPIFAVLSAYGARVSWVNLEKGQAVSKEEIKQELQRAQKEALQDVMQEAA
jgi:hypothetical protein